MYSITFPFVDGFTNDFPKTVDTNSAYLAKFCFGLGMNLKRIEVIGDDEEEIIEAARRMSDHYDFVVTSGGIGPTLVHWQTRDRIWR